VKKIIISLSIFIFGLGCTKEIEGDKISIAGSTKTETTKIEKLENSVNLGAGNNICRIPDSFKNMLYPSSVFFGFDGEITDSEHGNSNNGSGFFIVHNNEISTEFSGYKYNATASVVNFRNKIILSAYGNQNVDKSEISIAIVTLDSSTILSNPVINSSIEFDENSSVNTYRGFFNSEMSMIEKICYNSFSLEGAIYICNKSDFNTGDRLKIYGHIGMDFNLDNLNDYIEKIGSTSCLCYDDSGEVECEKETSDEDSLLQ